MEQMPFSEDTSNVDTASPRMRQNRKDTYNRNEKGYSSGADLREHMAQWNRIKSSEIYSPVQKDTCTCDGYITCHFRPV